MSDMMIDRRTTYYKSSSKIKYFIELDQFSIDDKQEEIEDIAVFKEDWLKIN